TAKKGRESGRAENGGSVNQAFMRPMFTATIATFQPQRPTLRSRVHRRSPPGLRREYQLDAVKFNTGESIASAESFASGAGRHGQF
ncbi:MAG TPA: hypothetical protein VFT36_06765, partial [Methylomirabilota bacterium]|nr:hypothetical protein [Methylomirabilota bacterium]